MLGQGQSQNGNTRAPKNNLLLACHFREKGNMPDPTLLTLEKFQDPTAWERIVRNVPIFTVHERKIKNKDDEEVTVKVDETRLKRILAILQKRLKETGVVPVIREGHTLKGSGISETDQPDILGFTPYFRMGTFGPERKPAILTDMYFLPGKFAQARQYPFRSAEIYPYEFDPGSPYADQLTGVALLKKDPALDMGILTYGERQGCYHYALESAMPDENLDPTKIPGQEPEGPDPEFQEHFDRCMNSAYPHMSRYYKEHIAKHYEHPESEKGAEEEKKPEALKPNGQPVEYPRDSEGQGWNKDSERKAAIARMEEEGEWEGGKGEHARQSADMVQYRRELEIAKKELSNHKAALQQLTGRLADEEKTRRLAQYERDLTKLQMEEGFSFDLKDEMAEVADFTPGQFAKHLARIQKNYQRAPINYSRNGGFQVYSGPVEGMKGHKDITPDMVQKAVQHGEKNNLTFDQAFEKLHGFRADGNHRNNQAA
jgi:hypothetical protein